MVGEFPVVLDEEGVVDLEKVDLGVTGDESEGGSGSSGKVEQSAAVLFEAGDCGGLTGD